MALTEKQLNEMLRLRIQIMGSDYRDREALKTIFGVFPAMIEMAKQAIYEQRRERLKDKMDFKKAHYFYLDE